jgi:hypothetical protein
MAKIRLIEAVSAPEQIVKSENLPSGILSRVRRTICEIGVKNANNRVYEKAVWEKVLNDSDFKKKLENRQILGRIEHPVDSQIKLDQDTSHIVSNIFIDEATNTVKADFDILPTNGGKFIQVLLDAGVKVPCSSRADGELEERVDETGNKYSRVIPEAYQFITIDNTGDPSCGVTEPESIIKATKEGYESHNLTKNTAMALLETVGTDEAKKLEEEIKTDKQHECCKFKLGEKKCSGNCSDSTLFEKYLIESKRIIIEVSKIFENAKELLKDSNFVESLALDIENTHKTTIGELAACFVLTENKEVAYCGSGVMEYCKEISQNFKNKQVVSIYENINGLSEQTFIPTLAEKLEKSEEILIPIWNKIRERYCKRIGKVIESLTKKDLISISGLVIDELMLGEKIKNSKESIKLEFTEAITNMTESKKQEILSGIEDLFVLRKLELTEKQVKLADKLLKNKDENI